MAIKEMKRSCIRILCNTIHHNVKEWLCKLLMGLIQYISELLLLMSMFVSFNLIFSIIMTTHIKIAIFIKVQKLLPNDISSSDSLFPFKKGFASTYKT